MPGDREPLLQEIDDHRIIFVSGLHRSGTTFLARGLAEHPEVSGLSGTGARKDEGQSLQRVYGRAPGAGGPGHFGFDDGSRYTEASPEVSDASRIEVWSAWRPYWDLDRPVLVEKSPPNILRMRFLQALFPRCAHVVIVRHPIAVTLATRKWRRTTQHSLVHHWVHVHEVMAGDLAFLHSVVVVRYEDLVDRFAAVWPALLNALGLAPAPLPAAPDPGLNEKYFAQWAGVGPVGQAGHRLIERSFSRRIQRFGYGLTDPLVAPDLPSDLHGLPGLPRITPAGAR